jgi:hypothetical protein
MKATRIRVLTIFFISIHLAFRSLAAETDSSAIDQAATFTSELAKAAVSAYRERVTTLDGRYKDELLKAKQELRAAIESAIPKVAEAKDFAEVQRLSQFIADNAEVPIDRSLKSKGAKGSEDVQRKLVAENQLLQAQIAKLNRDRPIVFRHFVAKRDAGFAVLLPDGSLLHGDKTDSKWYIKGRTLELHWNGAKGYYIDRCVLNDAKTEYLGQSSKGLEIKGILKYGSLP